MIESITDKSLAYQVLATTAPADEHDRVLKFGDTFIVMNRRGDIRPIGLGEEGLYCHGTRFLSHYELSLAPFERPLLLSSNIKENNLLLSVDLTNPDVVDGDLFIPRGSLHINRAQFVVEGVFYERIAIWNCAMVPLQLNVTLRWAADFVDLFEVRGQHRPGRGELFVPSISEQGAIFQYRGLDNIIRRTKIFCSPTPQAVDGSNARFSVALGPKEATAIYVTAACIIGEQSPEIFSFDEAITHNESEYDSRIASETSITTSNPHFNHFMGRSLSDLRMLISKTECGPYPYAGIPWYSTVFGRDGLITALQMLWINPDIAKGVLLYLASRQAMNTDSVRDAEPGKILHEVRSGEMANLNEIPFSLYYGAIDSTPLFVILACAYFERTGDIEVLQRLWPHIERALDWINQYGDIDGDGFVEYVKRSDSGLRNQGWKDSHDSIFHLDGSLAEPPIALCEAQAYVYDAKQRASKLASLMDRSELAWSLREEAAKLKERFLEKFWIPELGTYALALDGAKKPCKVRSSNAGHCLFSGIASPAHAREIANVLMSREFFSGWGIRTISTREKRYSPISYHNGSIWPHDNAMIGYGMAAYGFSDMAATLLEAFFDVSRFAEFHRLPELLCGFERQSALAPTWYPVACRPQAWASASVFMLLQACLGISINGSERKIFFSNPVLPRCLNEVRINNLMVGRSSVDLRLQAFGDDVVVNVMKQTEDLQIVVNKFATPSSTFFNAQGKP